MDKLISEEHRTLPPYDHPIYGNVYAIWEQEHMSGILLERSEFSVMRATWVTLIACGAGLEANLLWKWVVSRYPNSVRDDELWELHYYPPGFIVGCHYSTNFSKLQYLTRLDLARTGHFIDPHTIYPSAQLDPVDSRKELFS